MTGSDSSPSGKTPEPQAVNGKPDFYLGAVNPKSAAEGREAGAILRLGLFRPDLRVGDRADQEGQGVRVRSVARGHGPLSRRARQARARTARSAIGPIEESLDLFVRMKNGEFPDGKRTLRAKIDMASPNIWMRDPVLYRIRHSAHHHTGDKWCIYPMYDFAHCLSDYIEGITHSICTLEFEVHRPLYDWILENLDLPRPLPHQYEFAKLSPDVHHHVQAQADPARERQGGVGLGRPAHADHQRAAPARRARRRRCASSHTTSASRNSTASPTWPCSNTAIREDLNKRALRRLAVLRPLKVVITNIDPQVTSRNSTRSTIPKIRPPARARSRSATRCTSSRTTSWKRRRRNSSD